MAIQTTYLLDGGGKLPSNRQGRAAVLSFQIDTKKTPVASGDILKLMPIPANTLVKDVIVVPKKAEGGTLTVDIGDYLEANDNAVDADGFLDGGNLNATNVLKASTETLVLTEGAPNTAAFSPAYARGKFYPAETAYLGILFNDAADAAIFDVHVECVNCEV